MYRKARTQMAGVQHKTTTGWSSDGKTPPSFQMVDWQPRKRTQPRQRNSFHLCQEKKYSHPAKHSNTAIRLQPQSAELAKQDYVRQAVIRIETAPNERPQPLSRGRVVLLALCLGFCANENGGSYYRGVMITSGAAPSLRRAREASMWPFMLEMCSADAPSLRIDGEIGPGSTRQAANRNRNARVLHRDPTCYVWGCAGFVKTKNES